MDGIYESGQGSAVLRNLTVSGKKRMWLHEEPRKTKLRINVSQEKGRLFYHVECSRRNFALAYISASFVSLPRSFLHSTRTARATEELHRRFTGRYMGTEQAKATEGDMDTHCFGGFTKRCRCMVEEAVQRFCRRRFGRDCRWLSSLGIK